MKFEIGYSSDGGFLMIPFDEDNEISREAAVAWKRRVVDISQKTLDRWEMVSREWYAMQTEQRALHRNTAPFTEDSLVLTYKEPAG